MRALAVAVSRLRVARPRGGLTALGPWVAARREMSFAVPLGAALGAMAGLALPLGLSRSVASPEVGHAHAVVEARLAGDTDAVAQAWRHIDEILASPKARVLGLDLGQMAKALSPAGSETQQALVSRAVAAGLRPDAETLNALLNRLQVEGRPPADALALVEQMRALGAMADADTDELLGRSDASLERVRATVLRTLLRESEEEELSGYGHAARIASTIDAARSADARRLFESWLALGVARTVHLNLMLRGGFTCSEEHAGLIARAAAAGVAADVRTYTILIYALQLEGRTVDGALQQMSDAGIRADASLDRDLAVSPSKLSARRTHMLMRWLTRGGAPSRARAWALYNGLLARRAADYYQLGAMMSHGGVPIETMRQMLNDAPEHGIEPTATAYNALLSRLVLEGRPRTDLAEIIEEMRSRGAEPDRRTLRIVERTADECSAMRTAELSRRLQSAADPDALRAAWELFSAQCENGAVDGWQVNAMRYAARRLERGEGVAFARPADEERYLTNFARAAREHRAHAREVRLLAHERREAAGGGAAAWT